MHQLPVLYGDTVRIILYEQPYESILSFALAVPKAVIVKPKIAINIAPKAI
jgi:hypothetical protein